MMRGKKRGEGTPCKGSREGGGWAGGGGGGVF